MKEEKILKLQAKISEYEADKDKTINSKVDFVTSDERFKKIYKN
jgi:hypothetical protein